MSQPKTYDERFFTEWSSSMAYILGFLYADGNIVKTNRGGYYIAFHSSDVPLLLHMRSAMGSMHKISKRSARSGNVYRLQIGSKKYFADLCALGLVPGKTKRMRLPKVPSRYFYDFVRGYFDGDGNVWAGVGHREQQMPTKILQAAFTSCSHDFLITLLERLQRSGVKGGSVFKIKNKNASRLILGTFDALKLAESMYNGPHKLYLPRKKRIFDQFVKNAGVAQFG